MRVSILCTHSVAGALSLGIVITSDEQMETLTVAFSLLKSIFPDDSFFGKKMPDLMANNCSELRRALSEVLPTQIFYFVAFTYRNRFVASFLIKRTVF